MDYRIVAGDKKIVRVLAGRRLRHYQLVLRGQITPVTYTIEQLLRDIRNGSANLQLEHGNGESIGVVDALLAGFGGRAAVVKVG